MDAVAPEVATPPQEDTSATSAAERYAAEGTQPPPSQAGSNTSDGGYDADAAYSKRARATYTIGGRQFGPVRKTGALVKRVLATAEALEVRDPPEGYTDDEKRRWSSQQALRGIDVVYQQVSMLLAARGNVETLTSQDWLVAGTRNPTPEWLSEELDLDDATEILSILMPERQQGNVAGGGAAQG